MGYFEIHWAGSTYAVKASAVAFVIDAKPKKPGTKTYLHVLECGIMEIKERTTDLVGRIRAADSSVKFVQMKDTKNADCYVNPDHVVCVQAIKQWALLSFFGIKTYGVQAAHTVPEVVQLLETA